MTGTAFGFPSNIRKGYNNCQTCHVSPSGGGVVTKYGKNTSESFMATWSYPGESGPLYGLYELPDWLDIGGDIRQVEIKSKSQGQEFHLKFLMQLDYESALHLSKSVTFVTSGGTYAGLWQRRRSYLLLTLSQMASIRLGKFFPAYSLMIDDHTKLFRRALGYDQGSESYNIEWSVRSQEGEIFVTKVLGSEVDLDFKQTGEVRQKPTGDEGLVVRLTKYLTKTLQLGSSFYSLTSSGVAKEAAGVFGLWGSSKKSYHMMSIDRIRDAATGNTDSLFYRYGWVLFQGFHLKFDGQYLKSEQSKTNQYGMALQWLPRPHWEFLGQAEISYRDSVRSDNSLLMVHYYF